MHTYEKIKGYTPQISLTLSGALRRMAWLHKETMVKTLERIVKPLSSTASQTYAKPAKDTGNNATLVSCLKPQRIHSTAVNSLLVKS